MVIFLLLSHGESLFYTDLGKLKGNKSKCRGENKDGTFGFSTFKVTLKRAFPCVFEGLGEVNLVEVLACFLIGLVIGFHDVLVFPLFFLIADLLLQPHSLPAVPVCARSAEKSFWQGHTSGLLGIQAGTWWWGGLK